VAGPVSAAASFLRGSSPTSRSPGRWTRPALVVIRVAYLIGSLATVASAAVNGGPSHSFSKTSRPPKAMAATTPIAVTTVMTRPIAATVGYEPFVQ
jgi:hypothetical protein